MKPTHFVLVFARHRDEKTFVRVSLEEPFSQEDRVELDAKLRELRKEKIITLQHRSVGKVLDISLFAYYPMEQRHEALDQLRQGLRFIFGENILGSGAVSLVIINEDHDLATIDELRRLMA